MKNFICFCIVVFFITGCASNTYEAPTGGVIAELSIENLYEGNKLSKDVEIRPYVSIYTNQNSCDEPQSISNAQYAGFKLAAESLVTVQAGYSVGYPRLNRGSFRRAIFSFIPKEGKRYKLLIDYNDETSVSLKLIDSESGAIEPIKQRKVELDARGAASPAGTCNRSYQEIEYSNEVFGKDTILNPTPEYSYSPSNGSSYATIETKIKAFDFFALGTSSKNLRIYDEPLNCSSYKELKGDSQKVLTSKIPANKELILLDSRGFIGAHCSVLFAFIPEAGKSYSINSGGAPLVACSIEVIDSVSQAPVDIYRKKIDRSGEVPKCVDVHADGNKKKFQKKISYRPW